MRTCEDKSKHLAEIFDLSKEREFWLDLSDYDVAKVLRYLIEFTRHDLDDYEAIKSYLIGFLDDIRQDDCNEHFERWCV